MSTLSRIPRLASKLLRDEDARKELKRRFTNLSDGGFPDIFRQLPSFVPTSGGDLKTLSGMTLRAAQNAFPILVDIVSATGHAMPQPVGHLDFCDDPPSRQRAEALSVLFDKYGSDKTSHQYHYVYGKVLDGPKSLLEIGMGTNNEDVVSTMGRDGKPGASLRAFRDFLPEANIYGADIDRRILFTEDRIQTYHADQTDLESLNAIPGQPFDIIIDDGLHTVDANLSVLLYAINALKPGGWLIIEDVLPAALPVWQVVSTLLPYSSRIIQAQTSLMFAMRKAD